MAKAPYNFVPLNDTVVPAEKKPGADFPLDVFHKDRHTGWVDLTIEAKTPIYIRDTINSEEMKLEKTINPDFFSPGPERIPRIPGSSIRGMIRTLVEIMSWGAFRFFDGHKKFFFRAIQDVSKDLQEAYKAKMFRGDMRTGIRPAVKAGFVTQRGPQYFVAPAQTGQGGCQYYRIEDSACRAVLPQSLTSPSYKIDYKKIYFSILSTEPSVHWHRDHRIPLFYGKAQTVAPNKSTNNREGFLVHSGPFGRIKHMHWIVLPPNNNHNPIPVAKEVIDDYRNDENRDEDADVLKALKKETDPVGVPCFYIEEAGKIQALGHTPFFRLPYLKKIGDLVHHTPGPVLDIPEAMFGNETEFGGRVWFEDAFLESSGPEGDSEPKIPQILSGPKPTTFQHYVDNEQIPAHQGRHVLGLKDYNTGRKIRGHKLYWHKSPSFEWTEKFVDFNRTKFEALLDYNHLKKEMFASVIIDESASSIKIDINKIDKLSPELKNLFLSAIGKYETQHTLITPLKPPAKFKGRIRFENLSPVELGALFFALDLPTECCHKIGMGKPLGLGSVRLTPTVHISDRKTRYEDLAKEWTEDVPVNSSPEEFKKTFERYILNGIHSSCDSLWAESRLEELRALLSFDPKPPDDQTTYMVLAAPPNNPFAAREILPKPKDVLGSGRRP